jgi:hypothetical protein
MDPAQVPVLEGELARVAGVFAPHDAGRYSNFTEERHEVEAMYPAGTVPRLRAVRAEYDSEGLFKANHAV